MEPIFSLLLPQLPQPPPLILPQIVKLQQSSFKLKELQLVRYNCNLFSLITSAPPVTSTASNADAVKADSPPVATSTVSKPFAGGLFDPSSPTTTNSAAAKMSFHKRSAVQTSTASTATTAAPAAEAAVPAASKSTLLGLLPVTSTVTSTWTPVITSSPWVKQDNKRKSNTLFRYDVTDRAHGLSGPQVPLTSAPPKCFNY
uniref:Uncharacterized protein n=1 Tax=Echinococcus granulosus TaxID=6210 RepID=A0A068WZ31_ECHGR|nr:hypothetical protein EgrG_002045300 [Echinococcus granulosus]